VWISRTAELCLEEAEAAEARAAVLNSPARRRANREEEGLLAMRGDGGGDPGRGRAGKEEGAAEACVGAWRLRKSDAAKRERKGMFSPRMRTPGGLLHFAAPGAATAGGGTVPVPSPFCRCGGLSGICWSRSYQLSL
jgi:hypothetical protein